MLAEISRFPSLASSSFALKRTFLTSVPNLDADALALLLAAELVAHALGGWVLARLQRDASSPYLRLAVGAVILALFISLPWVGELAVLAALAMGLGALVVQWREVRAS